MAEKDPISNKNYFHTVTSGDWKCPNCGHINLQGLRYCSQCSTQIGRECPNTACPKPHELIFIDSMYCPHCGINIHDKDIENLKNRLAQIHDQNSEYQLKFVNLAAEINRSKKMGVQIARSKNGSSGFLMWLFLFCEIIVLIPIILMGLQANNSNINFCIMAGLFVILGNIIYIATYLFNHRDHDINRSTQEQQQVLIQIEKLEKEAQQIEKQLQAM